ncbi:hypothetical protein [Actinomadura sp. 3N407]|uniref:hypothetical protein n=1 Tax=Actinomadura sp. 3N407 TaxID=3457423 RepID=UPI003FCDA20C
MNQLIDASIHTWCATPTGQSVLTTGDHGRGLSGSSFVALPDRGPRTSAHDSWVAAPTPFMAAVLALRNVFIGVRAIGTGRAARHFLAHFSPVFQGTPGAGDQDHRRDRQRMVEVENYRSQVRRIEWDNGAAEIVDPSTGHREPFKPADAAAFLQRFLQG